MFGRSCDSFPRDGWTRKASLMPAWSESPGWHPLKHLMIRSNGRAAAKDSQHSRTYPRVAPTSQPWAERRNPVGIEEVAELKRIGFDARSADWKSAIQQVGNRL